MNWPLIQELAESVNSGQVSARSQVEKALGLIADHEEFRAIIATTEDRALERAELIDSVVADGKNAGRLAGVPFIAKDNFLVFGAQTTAASNILKGFNAPYQATAIERLEAEGAICVAKANLDAFAHGSSTENSDYMTTKNPHDETRVPGGSSGGSAAAVALSLTPFALGTDTGGSIRQPASFCGVVGLKPSYGLVSRSGVVAMISSTDTIGPLAKTVEEVALITDVIAGQDKYDSTTIPRQVDYADIDDLSSLKGKRVGVIKEYFGEGLDDEVRSSIDAKISSIKSAGAKVEEISIPSIELALPVYYIICPAEISSNLARYDGQRFGFSDQSAKSLDDSYELSRQIGFGSEAKRRIMIGAYVLSSGYYDAYYKKAQTVRTKLINEFNKAFNSVDFLVGPVSPVPAFKIGENDTDPLSMYLLDIMTVGPSVVGVPAISVPCEPTKTGLPIGIQLISRQRRDKELLGFAQGVERLND